MKVALHRLKDGLAVNEASQRTAVSTMCVEGVANGYLGQVKVKESTASFQFDKVLPGPYVGMYMCDKEYVKAYISYLSNFSRWICLYFWGGGRTYNNKLLLLQSLSSFLCGVGKKKC